MAKFSSVHGIPFLFKAVVVVTVFQHALQLNKFEPVWVQILGGEMCLQVCSLLLKNLSCMCVTIVEISSP